MAQVSAICDAAMREFGVPERIRTDNGAPFAGQGLLGLSKLSLSWERFWDYSRAHPTWPTSAKRPPRKNTSDTKGGDHSTARLFPVGTTRKFDRFRVEFNEERPHEALNNETPGSIYRPSAKIFSKVIPEFLGEEIALEHKGDGVYRAFYRHLDLGEFDSAELKFYPRRKAI